MSEKGWPNEESLTLKHILQHWTAKIEGDAGCIDLPFNLEKFCLENDEKLAELEAAKQVIAFVRAYLGPEKSKDLFGA
jgi:hypothetical protein